MNKESVVRSQTQQTLSSDHHPTQPHDLSSNHPDFPQLQAELQHTSCLTDTNGDIFHQLQCAVRDGSAPERFPIGTIIPDTWTGPKTGIVYSMPFIVVDYRSVQLAANHANHVGVVLLRQNATPYDSRFWLEEKNTYSTSRLHAYLNNLSDDSETGYLAGCSPELLDTITPIMISITNLWGEVIKTLEAKFFAPSMEELHFIPDDNPEKEALTWKYFQDATTNWFIPCDKRIFRDPSGAKRACRLRSADQSGLYFVWNVHTDGSAYADRACMVFACTPACVIA